MIVEQIMCIGDRYNSMCTLVSTCISFLFQLYLHSTLNTYEDNESLNIYHANNLSQMFVLS